MNHDELEARAKVELDNADSPEGQALMRPILDAMSALVDTRLAVTPDQIRDLRLPTAPQRPGEKLSFAGETCQAEASAPDVLGNILLAAIEARFDHDAYDAVLRLERATQRKLMRMLRVGGDK